MGGKIGILITRTQGNLFIILLDSVDFTDLLIIWRDVESDY